MLKDLLFASDAFQKAMERQLDQAPPLQQEEPRHRSAAAAAMLSIEHGSAARRCFAVGCPHSGTSLIRLQFEALVRGSWALYAAPDDAIQLMSGPLTMESDVAARKLPGATVMLKELIDKAPHGLSEPLRQFHAAFWHGLNSYVHAGIHPLHRSGNGYPVALAGQQLRGSNAILHFGYRQLAALSGSQAMMQGITELWLEHAFCLPVEVPTASST